MARFAGNALAIVRRLAPVLTLLALALIQFPWVLCACDECGFFTPGVADCNCPGHGHGHAQADLCGHRHHGNGHDHHGDGSPVDDGADDDHSHLASFLAVPPYAGDVELDSASAAFLAVLDTVSAVRVLPAARSDREGDGVPWDDRPPAAHPDAGLRLLL